VLQQAQEAAMSESITEDQLKAGTGADVTGGAVVGDGEMLDGVFTTESPADVGADAGETAREVAARNLGRLLYAPVDTWSRYVFHETDPHPFGG
jgi:hypothetical protein